MQHHDPRVPAATRSPLPLPRLLIRDGWGGSGGKATRIGFIKVVTQEDILSDSFSSSSSSLFELCRGLSFFFLYRLLCRFVRQSFSLSIYISISLFHSPIPPFIALSHYYRSSILFHSHCPLPTPLSLLISPLSSPSTVSSFFDHMQIEAEPE